MKEYHISLAILLTDLQVAEMYMKIPMERPQSFTNHTSIPKEEKGMQT